MRRFYHAFQIVLTLVLFIALGCGAPQDTAQKSSRQFLSVGTAPPGGAFFVVGGAIAQVVDDNKGDRNWNISAEATKGTQENIRRLSSGELDFALANAAISYFAVRGEGAWGTEQSVQAVMTLAPNVALFITPKSSGVKTLADMKGKRVVVGPAGAGFEYFLQPILKAHGITYDDFTPLNNTQAGTVDMLADGSAAVAFLGGAVPTASITQACASQDIHFIPYEESAKQGSRIKLVAESYRNETDNLRRGLDVQDWVERGLVDVVQVHTEYFKKNRLAGRSYQGCANVGWLT